MKNFKSLALCAFFLFVFSITGLAQQPVCYDGQVPVGGKCSLVQLPPVDEETKPDEKSLLDFDFILGLLKFL